MIDQRIEALQVAINEGRVGGEFPRSLVDQYHARNGHLSVKQWQWVERLAGQRGPEREQLPQFSGVMALFDRARAHLKHPKISLKIGQERLRLHVAGPRSKYNGSVMLTDGSGFGGKYYGRVDPNGDATLSMKVSPEERVAVLAVLRELAERPAELAAVYGKLTGACCFCNKELSDARSLAVGYGPVCAKHYGLPWDEAREAA